MNVEKVIKELARQYPGKKIIKNREEDPTEIICELEPGTAIAVIDRSEPHLHRQTIETYVGLRGELTIYKSGQPYQLREGSVLNIQPGEIHYAVGQETWVKVHSEPPWSQEDHILQ